MNIEGFFVCVIQRADHFSMITSKSLHYFSPANPTGYLILNIVPHFPAISQLVYLHLITVTVLLLQTIKIMTLLLLQPFKCFRANDLRETFLYILST